MAVETKQPHGSQAITAAEHPASSHTVVVPFKVTGGGPAPDGLPLLPFESAPHQATGTATRLGRYTGDGTFTLGSLTITPITGQVTGTFQGTFVFVAANGDRLATTYGDGFTGIFTGQLSADGTAVEDVTFDAIFTPDPVNSTGRFANVRIQQRIIMTGKNALTHDCATAAGRAGVPGASGLCGGEVCVQAPADALHGGVGPWSITEAIHHKVKVATATMIAAGIDAMVHFSMKTIIDEIGMSRSTTMTRIGAERGAPAARGESLGSPLTLIGMGA
jgi:hypothetical protein